MSNNEFEFNNIVLIDTCTFINLEHYYSTKTSLLMFEKIIDLDCPICISDLSMIELILGCNKEEELLEHINNLDNMEFLVFGRYDALFEHLNPDNLRNIIKNNELSKFKEMIKKIRNNILLSELQNMFLSYCQQLLMMMQIDDRKYWDGAFFLINDIFIYKQEDLSKLLFETMSEYLDNKKESKLLLSELYKGLLVALLPQLNDQKYNESDLSTRLEGFDSSFYFLKLFNSLGLVKDTAFGDLCYIKPMMERFKKNVIYKDVEEELTKDGINYVIMHILSKCANFDSHDLIDLLNISMAGYNNNINVHYFTDEDKWIKFAKIEQSINLRCPRIEISQLD